MTQETGGFAALGLNSNILAALTAVGYEEPSPIQAQAIPVILSGQDMIGQAQTGTGKTAAFALPILSKIDPAKKEPQALILAPTRELALQIEMELRKYAPPSVTSLAVYGGVPIERHYRALRQPPLIVIGTPGRLLDVAGTRHLDLRGVEYVVMDEAEIGEECILGALTFIKAAEKFPRRSLIVGNPATIIKEVSDEMIKWKSEGTRLYQRLPGECMETLKPCEPLRKIPDDRPQQDE